MNKFYKVTNPKSELEGQIFEAVQMNYNGIENEFYIRLKMAVGFADIAESSLTPADVIEVGPNSIIPTEKFLDQMDKFFRA